MLDFRVSSFKSIASGHANKDGRERGIDIIKDTILTFSVCLQGATNWPATVRHLVLRWARGSLLVCHVCDVNLPTQSRVRSTDNHGVVARVDCMPVQQNQPFQPNTQLISYCTVQWNWVSANAAAPTTMLVKQLSKRIHMRIASLQYHKWMRCKYQNLINKYHSSNVQCALVGHHAKLCQHNLSLRMKVQLRIDLCHGR